MSRVVLFGVILGIVLFSLGCAHEGHHRNHHNHNHSDHQYHGYHHGYHHGHHNHSDDQYHGYHHGEHNHSDYEWHGYHDHIDHYISDEVSFGFAINSINRLYSNAEASLRGFCERNTKVTPKILFGQNAYIIKYALPNKNNLNITVKAINRLIITEVKELEDFKGFHDIRILPEMLNLQSSMWSIEGSYLQITLPYKVTSNAEFDAECPQSYGEVNISSYLVFNLPKFVVRSYTEQQKDSNNIKN